MRFPRREYWSGEPVPSPEDLPDPGIEPAFTGGFFTTGPPGKPGGSDSKGSACDVGDPGSIPGSGRSPG